MHAILGCRSHMMTVKPCAVHAVAVTAWVAAAECTHRYLLLDCVPPDMAAHYVSILTNLNR